MNDRIVRKLMIIKRSETWPQICQKYSQRSLGANDGGMSIPKDCSYQSSVTLSVIEDFSKKYCGKTAAKAQNKFHRVSQLAHN